jgi:hypothetical protein
MRNLKKIIAVVFFLVNQFVNAQDSIPSFVRDSLDVYVQRALQDWQIPGVAVCVIKDGKLVVMKGYGVKDLDTKEKVDENTLFMIGSNTKAFTATALAMLNGFRSSSWTIKRRENRRLSATCFATASASKPSRVILHIGPPILAEAR